ncbi:hypothetical protein IQ06DRAFT_345791 [Phaeosphaeriaceae sp. SRC1lsM3a]|nr:hypothetical protein IQ06DRAFT_345791 [Stagonospora sp. SRC1lsM3a]
MEPADLTLPVAIGTLPTELLLLIVSHLDILRGVRPDRASEDDRQTYNSQILKTLYSLTLTCRRFAIITTPHLYCSIVNTSHHPDVALCLLRTLDRKPQLAQYIRYVECPFWRGEPPESFTCYSKDQLDWIQDVIARAKWSIDDMNRIHDQNKMHDHFDFWTFHTHQRTQIGVWYRICSVRDKHHPLFALITIMMLASNLSEVAAPSTRDLAILAFKDYSHHTGLRTLCIFGDPCQDNHMVLRRESLPQGAHALENFLLRYLNFQFLDSQQALEVHVDDVSLNVYDAETAFVADDVKLFTSLRSLSCRWWENEPRSNSVPPPEDMALPLLGQALRSLEHSLERLTIDTLECAWPIDMESDISPLGSLQSFHVLKHLDVSGLVLFGDYHTAVRPDIALSRILPTSLESLKVDIEWDDEIEEVLYAYLSDCALSQPALKTIECSWRPAPKDIAKHLIGSYRAIGVKLVLTIEPT